MSSAIYKESLAIDKLGRGLLLLTRITLSFFPSTSYSVVAADTIKFIWGSCRKRIE